MFCVHAQYIYMEREVLSHRDCNMFWSPGLSLMDKGRWVRVSLLSL